MVDEYTVESALAELRETFPDKQCEVLLRTLPIGLGTHGMRVLGWAGSPVFYGDSLSECMAQVKKWREVSARGTDE